MNVSIQFFFDSKFCKIKKQVKHKKKEIKENLLVISQKMDVTIRIQQFLLFSLLVEHVGWHSFGKLAGNLVNDHTSKSVIRAQN